jgi:hypothetical protein
MYQALVLSTMVITATATDTQSNRLGVSDSVVGKFMRELCTM